MDRLLDIYIKMEKPNRQSTGTMIADNEKTVRLGFIRYTVFIVLGFVLLIALLQITRNIRKAYSQFIICHSLGSTDNLKYINSIDVAEDNLQYGYRYYEVDFDYTSDGYIICIHDWERWAKSVGLSEAYIPTYEEYKSHLIFGRFTPTDLQDVINFAVTNDVYLITDTKSNDLVQFEQMIARIINCAEESGMMEDHLIVQVYSEDQLLYMMEAWPKYSILLTTYLEKMDETRTIEMIEKYHQYLWCITVPKKNVTQSMIIIAKEYHLPLYVHTVNSSEQLRDLVYRGVKGIYTDILTPDQWVSFIE